uniref:Uncharacterized protein n=1 Tax=Acrobeloides nanus TaxID=290746 RepID=A0A914CL49_9BILA
MFCASINWELLCVGLTTFTTVAVCLLQYWKHFRPRRTHIVIDTPLEEVIAGNKGIEFWKHFRPRQAHVVVHTLLEEVVGNNDFWKYCFRPKRTHVVVHQLLEEVVVGNHTKEETKNDALKKSTNNGCSCDARKRCAAQAQSKAQIANKTEKSTDQNA